jgi:hypothetical protein
MRRARPHDEPNPTFPVTEVGSCKVTWAAPAATGSMTGAPRSHGGNGATERITHVFAFCLSF